MFRKHADNRAAARHCAQNAENHGAPPRVQVSAGSSAIDARRGSHCAPSGEVIWLISSPIQLQRRAAPCPQRRILR